VIFSEINDKPQWIEPGRCYERPALEATALEPRSAFINEPVEAAALPQQFASFLGIGDPRLDQVVRIGPVARQWKRPLRGGEGTAALNTEIATKLVGRGNPVATLRCVTIRAGDDALEDAAVLLDGFDGSDVVIVTRHEHARQAQLLACNLERLPEDRGGIALPPVLRDHDVANVPTKTLEI
jgi:hypothetical protein